MRRTAPGVDVRHVSTSRLSAVPDAPARRPAGDPRVQAAARVLAGEPVDDVAVSAGVDAVQLQRWADALTAGGAAAVAGIGLERPSAGPAAGSVAVEDFLSVVAHELRTPLTAARTALRVLAAPEVAPEVRSRVGRTVLDRLADLDRLTLDVLDAVGVVSGRTVLDPQRVALADVVDAACAQAGVRHVPGPALHVRADPVRTATVVATLLKHAQRYAAPDAISVATGALPEDALLTVRLSGVAVDPQAAAALFEPFGAAARGDGNGLSLYVVRALVVASGGAVGMAGSVDGPAPATVLWVRLPLHEPSPAPRRPVPVPVPRGES